MKPFPDATILRVMVDEHEANFHRDASYAALNCDIDEPSDMVERVALFFIDRLLCDGVVRLERLLDLITELSNEHGDAPEADRS